MANWIAKTNHDDFTTKTIWDGLKEKCTDLYDKIKKIATDEY